MSVVSYDFGEKVALVTGATSGIGEATAKMFAKNGAKTVVAGRNKKRGAQIVEEIKADGGEATFIDVDMQDQVEIKALIDKTVETYGGLDYAFNNAGISGRPALTHETKLRDFHEIIDVNLNGVFLNLKYQLEYMVNHGGGNIVNCSSYGGTNGVGGMAAYTASKHGVIGLTKAAAVEYAKLGIRINAVCPGSVQTPLIEALADVAAEISAGTSEGQAEQPGMNRVGRPEEVGEAVLWLCSDAASFVTGAVMAIDGGMDAG
jgi:NAD(P)-dependent dehydrogenase (short-subunit alcohol dehydrogenase family)